MQHRAICLWIGPTHRKDHAPALRELTRDYRVLVGASPQVFVRSDLATRQPLFSASGRHEVSPQLIVLATVVAGQIGSELLAELARRWPSARRILLAGDWCAAGKPGGRFGGRRVAEQKRGAELKRPGAGRPADSGIAGSAVIVTEDAELAEALLQSLWTEGWLGIWAPWRSPLMVNMPSVVVVDLPSDVGARDAMLGRVARRFAAVPIVAIASFPRALEIAQLRAQGVAEVVARPCDLGQLLEAVQQFGGPAFRQKVLRRGKTAAGPSDAGPS